MPSMVVVSDPGSEFDVRDRVDDSGFQAYLPLTRDMRIIRGRKVWSDTPLFGRYMFVDQSAEWRRLFGIRGVHSIFLNPDTLEPLHVRDAEITRIRKSEKNGYVVVDRKKHTGLKKGQHVRVRSGPMSGFEGVFDGTRQSREAALLDIFGRGVRVEFDPGVLVQMSDQAGSVKG